MANRGRLGEYTGPTDYHKRRGNNKAGSVFTTFLHDPVVKEEVRQQCILDGLPINGGGLSRKAAEKWRGLPEEEKEQYQARHEEKRARLEGKVLSRIGGLDSKIHAFNCIQHSANELTSTGPPHLLQAAAGRHPALWCSLELHPARPPRCTFCNFCLLACCDIIQSHGTCLPLPLFLLLLLMLLF
jgi:hypothetical protein